MSEYTKINIGEVEDLAPQYGMDEICQARFARGALGAQQIGMAYYELKPGQRLPFGHRHAEDEEVYLVQSGSGRFKVGDEVFGVGPHDVVFVPPHSMRSWEGSSTPGRYALFSRSSPSKVACSGLRV